MACERCGETECYTTTGRNYCAEDFPTATDRTTARTRAEHDEQAHAEVGGEG